MNNEKSIREDNSTIKLFMQILIALLFVLVGTLSYNNHILKNQIGTSKEDKKILIVSLIEEQLKYATEKILTLDDSLKKLNKDNSRFEVNNIQISGDNISNKIDFVSNVNAYGIDFVITGYLENREIKISEFKANDKIKIRNTAK